MVGKPAANAPSGTTAKPGDTAKPGGTAKPGDAETSVDIGHPEASPVERLGAAATALNSKLDLNGKLDRGREALRSLTGPNKWRLGGLTSSRTPAPATGPSEATAPYTPSWDSEPAGAGSSGASSHAGARYGGDPFTASAGASGGAAAARSGSASGSGRSGTGYADPMPSSASYGGPAAASSGLASGGSGRAAYAAAGAAGAAGAGFVGTRAAGGPSGPAGSSASAWRPSVAVQGKSKRKDSRRQAQLTLSRVEPWSVMKFSFVVSVAAFIVLFVAVALLYMVLSSLGVFHSLQDTVNTLTSAKNQAGTNVSSWFSASRILGYTGMLGALNIVLITAISTIGAVIYNLIAHTIGGIEVTLKETD